MDYGDELIETARKRREMEKQMLDENGNTLKKDSAKVNYIIDQLINHEEKFSNQEIREHLMVRQKFSQFYKIIKLYCYGRCC
jgi:hypothetical protein